jgi:hypothetical protein
VYPLDSAVDRGAIKSRFRGLWAATAIVSSKCTPAYTASKHGTIGLTKAATPIEHPRQRRFSWRISTQPESRVGRALWAAVHIPFSPSYMPAAYSNLYASALLRAVGRRAPSQTKRRRIADVKEQCRGRERSTLFTLRALELHVLWVGSSGSDGVRLNLLSVDLRRTPLASPICLEQSWTILIFAMYRP